MKVLHDYRGLAIRLTDERQAHIHEHPEMLNLDSAIEQTLAHPQFVVQSAGAEQASLYYRFYLSTMVGDKYLCVVVKVLPADAFKLTAYLTDKVKEGERLWPTSE